MKTRISHTKLTKFGLLLLIPSILLISSCNASQGKPLFSPTIPFSILSIENRTRNISKIYVKEKKRERDIHTINIRSNFLQTRKCKLRRTALGMS
jgi:hypothetical protein